MDKVKFAIIAAIDEEGGLGYQNRLLIKSPSDMIHFRKTTINNIVIMGRNTFQSLHGGVLKDRINIVVSTKLMKNIPEGVIVVSTPIEALAIANTLKLKLNKEIFVIGGAKIYDTFLPFAEEVILTQFNKTVILKDTFFDSEGELENYSTYRHETLDDGDGKITYYRRVLSSSRADLKQLKTSTS